MDARAKTVRELLHSGDQYLIPFFQRYYSWKRSHWERLFNDVWALTDTPHADSQHFLGPLVCTPARQIPGEVPAFQLIDGQQRLTTLTLLLAAIRDLAAERGFDGLAEQIMEDYLIHKRQKDLKRYKVVPRVGDRDALIAVIDGQVEKAHKEFGVYKAWRYFCKRIEECDAVDEALLRNFFIVASSRLSLVVITIDDENPYEIFESLNSTGLPLEESDLIRNYIFMQVPIDEQERFNDDHWSKFEDMFDAANGHPEIGATPFYRNYLMRNGTYSKAKMTFVDFKDLNREQGPSPADQVAELKRFLRFELSIRRPDTCEQAALQRALDEIRLLEVSTAHPLLMHLMDQHEREEIDFDELLGCIKDLASFVLRRSICGESTRSYGKWFVEAITTIGDKPREDLRTYWLRRGWPDDETFADLLEVAPLYRRETKKCRLVLLALEDSYGHKEKVNPDNLTIEHVMPQTLSGKSGKAWKKMLGESWEEDHESLLHTIGNLTLTGYNSDLSNKPFADKRADLIRSNLVMNRALRDYETWDADAIQQRGRRLALEVRALWPRPKRGAYVPASPKRSKMKAADRRSLQADYWTNLFNAVRERGVPPKLPKPAKQGWIGFPIGKSGFRILAFMNIKKRDIGVALACRGKNGPKNFEALRSHASEIESQVGQKLQWHSPPGQNTSYITLRKINTDPVDRSDWPAQHEWLATNLETFYDVFAERCKPLISSSKDESRHTLREKFWSLLLDRASLRTSLHSGISPSVHHWISTGAGMRGLAYNYVIKKDAAYIELYIDRGKGAKAENKRLFDLLYAQKEQVEKDFGGSLDWQRLDSKRACRIAFHLGAGGYRNEESDWPKIQDRMIDAMTRLEKALAQHVAALKSKLKSDGKSQET